MSARYRPLILAGAVICLLAALWAALLRIGWNWPVPSPRLLGLHGPLMVACFFSALISLERAVALGRAWAYAAPVLAVAGGLGLLFLPGMAGPAGWLLIAGNLVFLATGWAVIRRQNEFFTWLLQIAVVALLVGDLVWILGRPVFLAVWWWEIFLVLTIAAERLELGRLQRLPAWAFPVFWFLLLILGTGMFIVAVQPAAGVRVLGLGLAGCALWLLRFDIARRTVRTTALPRFVAVCLLSGYLWLILGGILMTAYGLVPAGPIYDALLHSIFVGFVFAMIFGHAPIIFPAVLGLPVHYNPLSYGPLALLNLSLVLRLAGDLAALPGLRRWGGLLNATAIVIFLGLTAATVIRGKIRGS